LFREAARFTAAETGFVPRLVEKDYFCTLLLGYLAGAVGDLVFKGGTCLAKVHAGFYRLSEDVDFVIPTPVDATRAERSRRAAGLKQAVARIDGRLQGFRVVTALAGANESTQYVGALAYTSLLDPRQEEMIRIEVSLREPLIEPAIHGEARTLLLDPVSRAPRVPIVRVPSLSRREAMAEKLRAALSRREAAIRDFYDVDDAVRRQGLRLDAPELVDLVRKKLAVPGNDPVDVSATRLELLRAQVDAELKPVLRARDFEEFDLDRAFASVAALAAALA
jgi:predicted nucleotidyltransferase component of viral defense system